MFLSSRLLEVVSGVRVWVANPHYVGYRGNDAGRRVGRVYIYDLTRFPSTTDKNKKRHTQTENIPSYRFGPTGSDIRSMPQLWNFMFFYSADTSVRYRTRFVERKFDHMKR